MFGEGCISILLGTAGHTWLALGKGQRSKEGFLEGVGCALDRGRGTQELSLVSSAGIPAQVLPSSLFVPPSLPRCSAGICGRPERPASR